MSASLEARVAELEKFVASLKCAVVGVPFSAPAAPPSHASAPSEPRRSSGPVADDALLDKSWADMQIRKDPPRTTQPSHVGYTMSQCTPEYLEDYAAFHEWKAKKGREENPPRLNAKGKPWYEGDELTAKVARGWAARIRSGRVQRAPRTEFVDDAASGPDDEVPF